MQINSVLTIVVFSLSLLVGCGQKGDLYLLDVKMKKTGKSISISETKNNNSASVSEVNKKISKRKEKDGSL